MRVRITGNFVHSPTYRQGDNVEVDAAAAVALCLSGPGGAIDDEARAILTQANKPTRSAAARPRAKARGAHCPP